MIVISAWVSGVARLDEEGQCESLNERDEWHCTDSHVSFVYVQTGIIILSVGESQMQMSGKTGCD